jgi:tetratricopeptide (TPR) repeat protein
VGDRLRPLWDFDDLDATEERFRAALDDEPTERGRADVLTQLARVAGLRGRSDEGERLVDEAEALAGPTARSRLERGRLRRSSGDSRAALPLFETAFAEALEAGELALAADAAHMAALAAPDREGMAAWTQRGLELAERSDDPGVRHWAGPLLHNLGWDEFASGRHERALAAFRGALEARERDPERPYEIQIARYAVAKALRALGRPQEAAGLLEDAVAWTRRAGKPDGWFHEELAESYAAAGRGRDAREHARLALPLLQEADASLASDPERVERLRHLAGDA